MTTIYEALKRLNEDHEVKNYKGFTLDGNTDNIDPEEATANFDVEIKDKSGKVINTTNGFRAARRYIDDNKLDDSYGVIKVDAAGEGDYYTNEYVKYVNNYYDDNYTDSDFIDSNKFFTADINKAAKFNTKREAEEYAYDEDIFYDIWAEDQDMYDCIKVIKESEII